MNRINFKKSVCDTLYKKAGGRCSVPHCSNPTIGPYYSRKGAVNMGVACHIYSAAKNGPRGRGDKDDDFISSEHNGIWCCAYHASLIDKSNGCDYPAAVLFSWKALAEARVLKQMNDIPSPLGWVESIEFTNFSMLKIPTKIMLSRNTLLYGKSASGKTSLLEMAASISRSKYAERFSNACAKVVYSTVDSLNKEVNLKIKGIELTRQDNLSPQCLLPPGDLEVIYCSDNECHKKEYEDDIDFMMRLLNIDKSALLAMSKIGTNSIIPGEIKFEPAEYDDEGEGESYPRKKSDGKPYFQLWHKKLGKDFFVCYDGLSGSEKGLLIIDLLITKAREVSKQRLTLLLIDSLSMNFDDFNFQNLLEKLTNQPFQIVVVLPPSMERKILLFDKLGEVKLQSLDYLESWRISAIGS